MPNARKRELVEARLFPDLHELILGALREAAEEDPLSAQILVTPTTQLASHLMGSSAWHARRSLSLRGVTWFELARALTSPDRIEEQRSLLSPEAAAWISRRFLERRNRPPGYFDAVLDVRGFRAALLRTFNELGRAGLASSRQLERFLVRHGQELSLKVRHVLELALGYRRAFEATHEDQASTMVRACETPHGRYQAIFQSARLWVYGFAEMSVLERRLLGHLAADRGLEVCVYGPVPAASESGLSAQLRDLGFRKSSRDVSCSVAGNRIELQVISAPSEESEAQEVTRRILGAAESGTPFQHVAVITRTTKQLEILHRTLKSVGVPCWLTSGRSLLSSRSGRALLQFLEMLENELDPKRALAFLSMAPLRWQAWCGISDDPVPSAWERVARDACLGLGIGDWEEKLQRLAHERRQRAESSDREGEPAMRARVAAAAASELLTLARALAREVQRFPNRATWKEFVRLSRTFLSNTFVESAETQVLHDALERLSALDVPQQGKATPGDFREAVRSLLTDVRIDHEPPRGSGFVTLGTAAALYGMDFEVVCIAGLREGDWPGSVTEDPVLLDRERTVLSEALGDPDGLPVRAAALRRERWLFRAAVESARRRVLLSYARLDPMTGASRLPSVLLIELAEEREGRSLDYATLEELPWFERVPLQRRDPPLHGPILSLPEFDALAVAALTRAAGRRYVRRLGRMPSRGLALDTLRNARMRFTEFDGWIHSQSAHEKLQREFEKRTYSASQLAIYATCPFRFFMRQVLRIEPLERDERREPNALEVGRLVHDILENFYRDLASTVGLTLKTEHFEALRDRLNASAARSFAEIEARGQTGAGLLWELTKQRLAEDLLRFLRHEIQRSESQPGWEPQDFERRFGPTEGLRFEVAREGSRKLVFRGIIDRIDRHLLHDGICVVDYKSGRKSRAQRDPQAVQLVLYLLAACGGDEARLHRSEGRFLYVTRRGGFQMQRLAGELVASRREEFNDLARAVARAVEGGEFFPEPGPGAVHCNGCDFRSVCDTRIAQQISRKSRSQQDTRYHSLPDFGAALEDVTAAGVQGRTPRGGET